MIDDFTKGDVIDFQGNPKPLKSIPKDVTLSIEYKDSSPVIDAKKHLLRLIDKICKENNLQYFAFGKLITGIVHYNDFIPDANNDNVDVGLLRKDYDILIENIKKTFLGEDIIFDSLYTNGYKKCQIRMGKIIRIESDIIGVSDTIWIYISPFDFLPDEFDARKSYYRKMERLNNRYSKLVSMTKTASGGGIGRAFLSIFKYAFVSRKRINKIYDKIYKTATKYKDTSVVSRIVPKRTACIEMDKLFPLREGKIGDLTIYYPNDFSLWTVKFDDELINRTKQIQKIDIIILKEFDRICRELNLGYFICGGTMLGHKRHNGFIPWDDDIDVGMLRADYNRFLAEAKKLLSEDFFLQTRSSDKKNPYLFSKIRMNETEYITNYNEKRKFHKGICLDIFPFDYIPNKISAQLKFKQSVRNYEIIHNRIANRQNEKAEYPTRPKTFSDGFYRFYNEIRRRIVWMLPLRFTQYLYIKKATKYNSRAKELKLTTVASFVPTYTYIDLAKMLPYKDVVFEGITVMSIKDEDAFLTMQYGDYMQLPLPHQRVGHDLVYWSISDKMKKKYNLE